jgi:putative flavoprotein involved in K+ transport
MERIETLIVGGGQGGLSVSYYLSQERGEHVILEAAERPAHAWRDDRWDSFCLVTPNWTFMIPGAEYDGDDPHGFMPKDEIVARFEGYVERYHPPVRFGVRVLSVTPQDQDYLVESDHGQWLAHNVVVATGLYQKPKIPSFAASLSPRILQLSSSKYRNPDALPPGAVLIAGSGQSGCQIAEELYQAGRKVYLCLGSAGRAPRRYRGKDIAEWLLISGFLERTVEQLPSPRARFNALPQVSGKNGGHTLNLHQFYHDGVTLLGRLDGAQDEGISLTPGLQASLAKVDEFEAFILKMVDEFIARKGLDAPPETVPQLRYAYDAPEILELDLKKAGIGTVIWAMGYAFDYSLVKLPVTDEFGFPITQGGATRYPGLYFAGMPWLDAQKTGVLIGVKEHAGRIASHLLNRK